MKKYLFVRFAHSPKSIFSSRPTVLLLIDVFVPFVLVSVFFSIQRSNIKIFYYTYFISSDVWVFDERIIYTRFHNFFVYRLYWPILIMQMNIVKHRNLSLCMEKFQILFLIKEHVEHVEITAQWTLWRYFILILLWINVLFSLYIVKNAIKKYQIICSFFWTFVQIQQK